MKGGRAGGQVGGKLAPLSVEMRQSGVPRGESYKDCEAGTVPAWVQSLVGGGPAKHARNPEGLQFGAQVPERGRGGERDWGCGGTGVHHRYLRPALGSLCIQAKQSVSTGGLDWQKPVPPRDTGGLPGGGGAQSLLRPSRLPAPPSAFRGAEAETPRPSWPTPLVAPRPPATPSAF